MLVLITGGIGSAHEEREAFFPAGDGTVPAYRSAPAIPRLVVCKPDSADRIAALPLDLRVLNLALLDECAFTHVQAAVDAVTQRGTTIYLLPGIYREEPSREPPGPGCNDVATHEFGSLSYADQARCPHVENLIAILGDTEATEGDGYTCNNTLCELQIEGTGATPDDVAIDGGFDSSGEWVKHNGIRADRADGIYLRNFTVQRFGFNAVYILETDGFVVDRVVARNNEAYGVLTFVSDHGLLVDCEAFNNGDGGLYPGSAADVAPARFAIEIARCKSHHNFAGFSGTSGNAIHAHDNDFHTNAIGAEMDSVFPHHPGAPQDGALFENNRIYSNNYNPYERWVKTGKCDQPPGKLREQEPDAICPTGLVPVGTGVMVAGGNANLFRENQIWDNWRYGFLQFYVPALVREELDPLKQIDTSHFNRYVSNRMAFGPLGGLPNGLDFWWDEQGQGNCWEANVSALGPVTSDPASLPGCREPSPLFLPFHPKSLPIAPCILYDLRDPILRDPPGCTWQRTPPRPGAP